MRVDTILEWWKFVIVTLADEMAGKMKMNPKHSMVGGKLRKVAFDSAI
jgi:hypothetical protein